MLLNLSLHEMIGSRTDINDIGCASLHEITTKLFHHASEHREIDSCTRFFVCWLRRLHTPAKAHGMEGAGITYMSYQEKDHGKRGRPALTELLQDNFVALIASYERSLAS